MFPALASEASVRCPHVAGASRCRPEPLGVSVHGHPCLPGRTRWREIKQSGAGCESQEEERARLGQGSGAGHAEAGPSDKPQQGCRELAGKEAGEITLELGASG